MQDCGVSFKQCLVNVYCLSLWISYFKLVSSIDRFHRPTVNDRWTVQKRNKSCDRLNRYNCAPNHHIMFTWGVWFTSLPHHNASLVQIWADTPPVIWILPFAVFWPRFNNSSCPKVNCEAIHVWHTQLSRWFFVLMLRSTRPDGQTDSSTQKGLDPQHYKLLAETNLQGQVCK